MKARLPSYLVFCGILLLFGSLALSSALLAQWRQWSGPAERAKLSASVDAAVSPSNGARLTGREAEKLSGLWGASTAYSARTRTTVSAGSRTSDANVIGVGGQYDRFTHIWLSNGVSVSPAARRERAKVAVIGSGLADRLFHSQDVIGLRLDILGAKFRVVGVYRERNSLLQWMTDDGLPDILVPYSALEDVSPDISVQSAVFEAKSTSDIEGDTEVRAAIAEAGGDSSVYVISDASQYYRSVAQKPALLLWICGLTAIWRCIRLLIASCRSAYRLIRMETLSLEWTDVVKRNRFALARHATVATAGVAGAAAIWLLVRFPFHFPADSIPGQLIDWSFYRDQILSYWQHQAARTGAVSTPDEWLQNRAGSLVTYLSYAGLAAGLPLCLIGTRMWNMEQIPVGTRMFRVFLFFLVAAALSLAIAWAAGIPATVDGKETAVLVAVMGLLSLKGGGRTLV
ncbi:ABC transporter permease [Cohnella nanjingensis]|uniref:ABC transporter permease n=1 Tax=Cohnella nanjingensis TaxID=1387779 RepID=A0A7X0VDH2_9BACL|nr:ABC transporter permease [Cohnella nanjingensis]MBB6669982.1 ABC transporter permease [Cohnella nanjingensis]